MFLQCLLIWIIVTSQLFPQAFDEKLFISDVLIETIEYSTAWVFFKKTSMTHKSCLNKPSTSAYERLPALQIPSPIFLPFSLLLSF